ncbi:MAG: MotA/TolQ/ExbB proton channel family protein [Gammaproteobacteria bacterium]|nr:MotA/TolQ/ExbB proton channel family protein [Gammaproteobacteria bacterium]
MFELLQAGGLLIWPILLCSILALAIIIERIFALKRRQVSPPGLTESVGKLLMRGGISPGAIIEIEGNSPLGRVLAAGLKISNQHRVVIKETMEEAGRHEIHELEKHLQTLGTIAAITPLLGLLGTVIGMIKVFSAITIFGVGDPQALAEGISEALVTTAAGLSVGIPSLMFHRYFRGKINELAVDMEQQAVKFMRILQQQGPVQDEP